MVLRRGRCPQKLKKSGEGESYIYVAYADCVSFASLKSQVSLNCSFWHAQQRATELILEATFWTCSTPPAEFVLLIVGTSSSPVFHSFDWDTWQPPLSYWGMFGHMFCLEQWLVNVLWYFYLYFASISISYIWCIRFIYVMVYFSVLDIARGQTRKLAPGDINVN